jgi:hypothetical protein
MNMIMGNEASVEFVHDSVNEILRFESSQIGVWICQRI